MDETEGSLIPYREWSNEVNQIFVSQNLCSYKNDSQKNLKIDVTEMPYFVSQNLCSYKNDSQKI